MKSGSECTSRHNANGLKLVKLTVTFIRDNSLNAGDLTALNQDIKALTEIIALEEEREALLERRALINDGATTGIDALMQIRSELRGIEEKIAERSGDRSDGIQEHTQSLYTRLIDSLTSLIKPTSLLEIHPAAIARFTDDIKPYMEPQYRLTWLQALQFTASIALYVSDQRRPVGDFINHLRSIDSVHLHQYANYIEPVLSAFLSASAEGNDIVKDFTLAATDENGNVTLHGTSVKYAGLEKDNFIKLSYELKRFEALMAIAQAIRDRRFTPGDFHTGREIQIRAGWNILQNPEKQVAQDTYFHPGEQVEFSTGANMSGKSYNQVSLTWSLAFGQATGYLPGTSARVPLFDRLIHIERVRELRDRNLSAFGTEVHYWKSIVSQVLEVGRTFLAADEPFSSTSPRDRDPLNFAVAALAAQNDVTAVLATHCRPPVECFIDGNPDRAHATHHEMELDANAGLSFTYRKMEGIADSDALGIAEVLGYPSEIITIARSLPSMTEFKKQ
jgi:dsDNA-specific endonuclease/ATPase MutS2